MAETNKKSDLKNPLLSIIIPHHGGANILNECLSSLEKSTYKDYEIIIVDNGSKDNSIKEAKNKFPYINILTQNKNLGYAGGCNRGAIHSNLIRDFYLVPSDFKEDGQALFRVLINPMVSWMWISGPILIFGTIFSLTVSSSRRRKKIKLPIANSIFESRSL